MRGAIRAERAAAGPPTPGGTSEASDEGSTETCFDRRRAQQSDSAEGVGFEPSPRRMVNRVFQPPRSAIGNDPEALRVWRWCLVARSDCEQQS